MKRVKFDDLFAPYVHTESMMKILQSFAACAMRIEEISIGMGGDARLLERLKKVERDALEYLECMRQLRDIYEDTDDRVAQTEGLDYGGITIGEIKNAGARMRELVAQIHDMHCDLDTLDAGLGDAIAASHNDLERIKNEPARSEIRDLRRQIDKITRDFDNLGPPS